MKSRTFWNPKIKATIDMILVIHEASQKWPKVQYCGVDAGTTYFTLLATGLYDASAIRWTNGYTNAQTNDRPSKTVIKHHFHLLRNIFSVSYVITEIEKKKVIFARKNKYKTKRNSRDN